MHFSISKAANVFQKLSAFDNIGCSESDTFRIDEGISFMKFSALKSQYGFYRRWLYFWIYYEFAGLNAVCVCVCVCLTLKRLMC